jgi:hypothetical protein
MVLVRKPDGKNPLGRARRRWEINIETYLKEPGWYCEDSVGKIRRF